jgi:N-acetylneuraminate synthase
LQCTSKYPVKAEEVGLNIMGQYSRRYLCPVGLSDHSGTIYPALAAVTLGAKVIEVHVTLSRDSFGPDVAASVTIGELKQLVEGVRFVESIMQHPVNKNDVAATLEDTRRLFGKSIVAAQDILKGSTLTTEYLTTKKPGTGIGADKMYQVLGEVAARDIPCGAMLKAADFA